MCMSKIKVMVLILLGVVALEVNAKPQYRIQTWVDNGTKMYLPEKKVWARIKWFPLPFKIWKSGSYPLKDEQSALWVINNWKEDIEAKRIYKESEYININ